MASPWQHPTTRNWYFRRAVPQDIRSIIGMCEVKRSLGTSDRDLARERFSREAVNCEQLFARARDRRRSELLGDARTIVSDYFSYWRENSFDPDDPDAWLATMLELVAARYVTFVGEPPEYDETRLELAMHEYSTAGDSEPTIFESPSWVPPRADFGWELVPIDRSEAIERARVAAGNPVLLQELGRELCRHLLNARNFHPVIAEVELVSSHVGALHRPRSAEFEAFAQALLEHLVGSYPPGQETFAASFRSAISPRLAEPRQPTLPT